MACGWALERGVWAWYFGLELRTTYHVPRTTWRVGSVRERPGGRVARWIVGDGGKDGWSLWDGS